MSEPLKAFFELCKEWMTFRDETTKIIYTAIVAVATMVLLSIICTTYYNTMLIPTKDDLSKYSHCRITTISSTEVEIKFR